MLPENTSHKFMKTSVIHNNSKNNKKGVIDLSPFFLFEAVGDSEEEFEQYDRSMILYDDAQSCSSYDVDACRGGKYRTSCNLVVNNNDNDETGTIQRRLVWPLAHKSRNGVKSYNNDDEDEDEEEEESEIVSTANSHSSNNCSKSNNNTRKYCCVNSTEGKKLSEKDRSRLFWESCLAS